MAIIQDWKIRGTQARCEVTGEAFADEQTFYTCIFEDAESDGFVRRDYSVGAWNEVRRQLDPAPFSFWKSTYKAPAGKADEESGAEISIEAMLRRFIDEDDPATENARYILALMLERSKTLIPTDTKETDTRTLLFYEHADSGEVFLVADPGLKLDEIESVQREVSELLAAEERRHGAGGSSEADSSEAGADGTNPAASPGADAESEGSPDRPSGDELLQPGDELAHQDEEETEEGGDQAPEAEDETVALAGEEALHSIGAEPGVDPGGELADEIDEDLEPADRREDPASHDHELQAEGRIE